ncbi:MAG: FHA domain-containing protein [Planctomycetales bacterium]|nr:FHA domain-containing protein [Planctomycetales bacterium]
MESLPEFVSRAHGLSLEEFRSRFPHPFLLLETSNASTVPDTGFRTSDGLMGAPSEPTPAPAGPSDGPVRDRIVPITKGRGSPFPGMITLGRAGNNDIVLKFTTISKFHAYFTKEPATGRIVLTDAGSTNGTFVNRRQVGNGQKLELSDGDTVNFGGDLDFTYFTTDGLHPYLPVLARRLAHQKA